MKTIGLIGGMSWESSATYYRLINEGVKRHRGGHHNARSVMVTVNFAEVEPLQSAGEWKRLAALMAGAARQVEAAGADAVVLCTNTMHKLADAITGAVGIPLLHIADVTGLALRKAAVRRAALLGTRFTMEEGFYVDRVRDRFGIELIVPDAQGRRMVNDVIYQELCLGMVNPDSRADVRQVIAELAGLGAQAVILGCTELGMLVSAADSELPVFDTTVLHAEAAVAFALG